MRPNSREKNIYDVLFEICIPILIQSESYQKQKKKPAKEMEHVSKGKVYNQHSTSKTGINERLRGMSEVQRADGNLRGQPRRGPPKTTRK